MTRSPFTSCAVGVAEAAGNAISELVGKPEASEMLRVGEDGTPTERRDQCCASRALRGTSAPVKQ